MTATPWRPVGAVPPAELKSARLQLHYAAQVPASVAHALLPARDDDGQSNLQWNTELAALCSRPLAPATDLRFAVAVRDFALLQLNGDAVTDRTPLTHLTLAGALAWAEMRGRRVLAEAPPVRRRLFDDFPDHGLARRSPFGDPLGAHLGELAAYFDNATAAFERLRQTHPDTTELRVWPHHFDLAGEIVLGSAPAPRSIGFGMTPGDASYAEPYFYVSPYPRPDVGLLPPLDGPGHWHTHGFTAAVLTATELLRAGTEPGRVLDDFLDGSIDRIAR